MNKRTVTTWVVVIVVVVVAVGLSAWYWNSGSSVPGSTSSSTVTSGGNPGGSSGTVSTAGNTQTIVLEGGDVALTYPSDQYGLATNPTQILTHSSIPPCDAGFDYCFYYNAPNYASTTFQSAGIAVKERTDLATEQNCLNTAPAGYTKLAPSAMSTSSLYSASVFIVGGGAAGSSEQGDQYRVFVKQDSACYQFQTRVAMSDFGNYPSGTIQEFTSAEQSLMQTSLRSILNTAVIVPSDTTIVLPSA